MPVEPFTLAAWVVATTSTLTAAAALAAARYVRGAYRNSAQALRILKGEEGVEDTGIVEEVQTHRKALLAAGLYPPRRAEKTREEGRDRHENREIYPTDD